MKREGTFETWIRKKEWIIDVCLLLLITVFLLSYFEPKYLFLKTTTTGGDTASHYYTAQYLRDHLIPHGRISGWTQGNYAGFPMLQFYFPLPFLLMVALSWFMPLQIAFKLITVLGTFLLPICAYYSLRLMGYLFPVPVLGAVFTLPFLFMEANSMWGGNILSTLAGEFTYSLGFALSILFIGSVYRGIVSGQHIVKNAVLIALIGFSHGYSLLFSGLASLFFLITTEDILRKFKYLFKIHVLGFFLMGFWIIPLLSNLPYTTRFNFVWTLSSIFEVFPVVLIPFVALAILGRAASIVTVLQKIWRGRDWNRIWNGLDTRIYYLWFCVIVGVVFYRIAYEINVVDIRFLPFLQVFLVIIAAVELGLVVQGLRVQWLFPVILAIFMFLWVDHYEKNVKSWIVWNYTGFEEKPLWPVFSSINNYLAGTASDPRVVYENSPMTNSLGTMRAFESLPLFSGRSTLEGLYSTASISSPFAFYIQSEISKDASCPLPDYSCSYVNLKSAIRHLKMFNVKDFIVRSDKVKSEIKRHPEFIFKRKFGPYELYELSSNENRYVTPLKYEPVLYETESWKFISYRWFRDNNINDVHMVFAKEIEERDLKRFKTVMKGEEFDVLPKMPIDISCHVEEEIKEEEIVIKTNCINKPLLIKVSYHPNWKVEGADKVYLVSPSFMLIFPYRENVRLHFSKTGVEYLGTFLTITALLMVTLNLPLFRENRIRRAFSGVADGTYGMLKAILIRNYFYVTIFNYVDRNRFKIFASTLVALVLLALGHILFYRSEPPSVIFKRGMRYYEDNRYAEARDVFNRIIKGSPVASATARFFYGMSYYKENNYQKSIEAFQRLIRNYPHGFYVPEAYYNIGLSSAHLNNMDKAKETYQFVIDNYPTSMWAKHANARLIELAQR